jgi:GT2 family glycosyltransferase/glycosyltransferase involved in cell wall biosynthesis
VRSFLGPRGSRREAVKDLAIRAFQVLKREGVGLFVRAIVRRMLECTRLHKPGLSIQAEEKRRNLSAKVYREIPPTESYDVFVFPIIDWNFRFQRPQQLALRIARMGHRVFYLNTGFHNYPHPLVNELADHLYEVYLPGPNHFSIYQRTMDAEMQRHTQAEIEWLSERLDIGEAICIVDLPFWRDLAFRLRNNLGWKIVYDCMNRHGSFSTNSAQVVSLEENLARGSDLVLVCSNPLLTEQSAFNPDTLLLPNAVDFIHFHQSPGNIPTELDGLKGPIIGYYGAISDWFDSNLVARLAQKHPEWQFVLIGNTMGADTHAVKKFSNIHLLGEKPYSELPGYLHAFDVCTIPFKKNPLTEAKNPVKLFEYLSTGKPIVATKLEELCNYKDYVTLVCSPEEWEQAITSALTDSRTDLTIKRVEYARQNTWDHRFAVLEKAVRALFPPVSILIVTFNQIDHTRLCLQSIFKKSRYPNLEVIVVDNASSDGSAEFIKEYAQQHPEVKVKFNSTNLGFATANNQAAQMAHGDYLIFLNNDTVVTSGWISGLLRYLNDPSVAMVGPVTNWCGNESMIKVTYKTMDQMAAFAREYTRSHRKQYLEMRMLALFCVAMRRATFEEVGPLDERFGIGMFEDDDYAIRIHQKEYKMLCAEDVFIHHWGKASFSKLREQEFLRLFEENKAKFEQKWGIQWEPQKAREEGLS